MKIAVISDVHGNLEALSAVIEDIRREGVDFTVCLGDIIGYYPDPDACVEIIRREAIYSVVGNHEVAVLGDLDIDHFSDHAREAILWTRRRLSPESLLFIASLPDSIRVEGLLFTHASPGALPGEFPYLFTDHRMMLSKAFSAMVSPICFVGHTHWPAVIRQGGGGILTMTIPETPIKIEKEYNYLINPGSVGQPRDRDHRASWGLFDTDEQTILIKKVAYHYQETQKKVARSGLPPFLAHRLAKGE